MASMQRAMIMLRKLNIHGIPREIRNALRDLQDIYSEPINLADDADSSDEETKVDLEDEGGNSHEAERENAPREGGQSHPIEDTSNLSQTGFGHGAVDVGRVVDEEAGDPITSMFDTKLTADKVGDYANKGDNVKSAAVQSQAYPMSSSLERPFFIGRPTNEWSRFWRWGTGATSQDAVKFFRRVL